MTQPLSASHALAIVDSWPFPLLVLNVSGQASGRNRAFEHLLEGLWACGAHAGGSTPLGDDPLQALIDAQRTLSWTEPSGMQRHFEIIVVTLPEHGGARARVFVDVTDRARLQHEHDLLKNELEQHTLTDSVTGLLGRRGLILALEPQVARSRRYNRPMSVVILSIDHRERQHSLLIEIAQLLKDQLRWADLIGCTEQQEFLLVLPETSTEAAFILAEKLAQRLGTLVPQTDSDWFRFGITGWRKNDSASTLLERAAQSMTHARAEQSVSFVAS
jgi:diguanylate cyclase (GGDEF)-like protein